MRSILLGLAVLLLVCGLSLDVSAQKKRKKKTQPLPMPTPVQTADPEVVSRASDEVNMEDYLPRAASTPAADVQTDPAAATGQPATSSAQVEELARQVRDLTSKIDSMDAKQKMLLDLEILSRAEQRSENLRKQLMDSSDKEAAIKGRLEQLEYEMRPDVIERNAAFIGSLRPEEVRESKRKALQSEKDRLTSQLSQLQNNRGNLETSLQNADAMVEKLRAKLEKAIDDQLLGTPPKKPE
jgi:chromosome segregation ATPase